MALAFVREIHRRPVDFPHQGPVNAENVSIWWRHHVQSAGTHVVLVASCPLYRVSLVAVMGWLAVESLQHRNSGNVLLNKANLRDLIAVTGLEILHKVDSNRRFLARVTWKFDEWPRKTLGHLSCTTLSFVHNSKAISEFKPELQSGNAEFGPQSMIFSSCVALKFDKWPWKTIRHLFYATSSLVHHFIATCEFKPELQPGNTQFGSKSAIFCPVWPWKFMDDLKNNRTPLLCHIKHHFIAICEFKLILQSGNG